MGVFGNNIENTKDAITIYQVTDYEQKTIVSYAVTSLV